MSADPQLAELWPDGTFGGARREPDEGELRREAARHLAELAAEVAAIDKSRSYGVHTCYQTAPPAAA